MHLATYLSRLDPTLLIDGDPNRAATSWSQRGSLPVEVIDERQAARFARDYEHIVIDTQARPEHDDLETLARGCDLLVIPTTPDVLALDALILTVDALKAVGSDNYRVLLTVVPPRPSRDGVETREALLAAGLPLFETHIRRYVAYQKAALAGTPVYASGDRRARIAWRDYQRVGDEIREQV